jgi:hypothetical protein
MSTYLSMYCGRYHRLSDGVPVEHSCRVLHPEYLRVERSEGYDRAAPLLCSMPLDLHRGVPRQEECGEGRTRDRSRGRSRSW